MSKRKSQKKFETHMSLIGSIKPHEIICIWFVFMCADACLMFYIEVRRLLLRLFHNL